MALKLGPLVERHIHALRAIFVRDASTAAMAKQSYSDDTVHFQIAHSVQSAKTMDLGKPCSRGIFYFEPTTKIVNLVGVVNCFPSPELMPLIQKQATGPLRKPFVTVGWFLHSSARGRGIAFAAAKIFLQEIREAGGASCVALVAPPNVKSQALALKLHFVLAGEIRDLPKSFCTEQKAAVFVIRDLQAWHV